MLSHINSEGTMDAVPESQTMLSGAPKMPKQNFNEKDTKIRQQDQVNNIIKPQTYREKSLPKVTTSTSQAYIHACALASARASATDALNRAFQSEKLPSKSLEGTTQAQVEKLIYDSAVNRLAYKLPRGGFIVESANFAAVACWSLMSVVEHAHTETELQEVISSGRPIFAEFLRQQEQLKRETLYPLCKRLGVEKYWNMSLMARDPAREYVSGAVRAVSEPFMKAFVGSGDSSSEILAGLDGELRTFKGPVWCEAGSDQARGVYAHFGFKVVGKMVVKEIPTWGMIYTGSEDG